MRRTKTSKQAEYLNVVPMAPLYTADLKIHLAKDKVWGREEARNEHRGVQVRGGPDGLWQSIIHQVTEMVGLSDSRFIMGLLINLINQFPVEERATIAQGVVGGIGMTIKPQDGEIQVVWSQEFDALPPEALPAVEENYSDHTVTPSGLVIPKVFA